MEFLKNYGTEEGEDKQMRHSINKISEDKMDWVIYEAGESGQDWKKVYAMNMERSN